MIIKLTAIFHFYYPEIAFCMPAFMGNKSNWGLTTLEALLKNKKDFCEEF